MEEAKMVEEYEQRQAGNWQNEITYGMVLMSNWPHFMCPDADVAGFAGPHVSSESRTRSVS
jgi:hypothetical protein